MVLYQTGDEPRPITSINSNISGIRTYVGADGKLHFTDAGGADTALPFSGFDISKNIVKIGTTNADNQNPVNTFNISNRPNFRKYTSNNFFLKANRIRSTGYSSGITTSGSASANAYPTLSYNASTGILTVNGLYAYGYNSSSQADTRVYGYFDVMLIDL